MTARPLSVFLVVGEESGDQLGARLVEALRARHPSGVALSGIAGSRLQALGLASLFPLHEIAVMGFSAVIARLPTIQRRIAETAGAVLAANPDVVVIVDSPDFTHRVAKAVRRARPDLPIVDYVSPSVWAWRPGRARKMAAYVDHLLALLPFEPEMHRRLGGPPTTYVGHPLVDRPALFKGPVPPESPDEAAAGPVLLVLPGSRSGEIDRMLALHGAAVARLSAAGLRFRTVLPAVPHLAERIERETRGWTVPPRVVTGEDAKFEWFRRGTAALATSGTVTLELALAGVPTVVAYRRDPLFKAITEVVRRIPGQVQVKSMVLPNIILGENVIPEHLDEDATPERLAADLSPLLAPGPSRDRQVAALGRLWTAMAPPGGEGAAAAAAAVVLDVAARRIGTPH